MALCHFEAEEQQHLCILQPGVLLVYAADGEVNTIPLSVHYSKMFPMQRGLLLAVSLFNQSQLTALWLWSMPKFILCWLQGTDEAAPRFLQLPTEDLQPVPTELKSVLGASRTEVSSGWHREDVIWVGANEAPFALTFNKVQGSKRQFSDARMLPFACSWVNNVCWLAETSATETMELETYVLQRCGSALRRKLEDATTGQASSPSCSVSSQWQRNEKVFQ